MKKKRPLLNPLQNIPPSPPLKPPPTQCALLAACSNAAIAAVDDTAPRARAPTRPVQLAGRRRGGLALSRLFAGTGALGFGTSRGAAFVLLNEWQRSARWQKRNPA